VVNNNKTKNYSMAVNRRQFIKLTSGFTFTLALGSIGLKSVAGNAAGREQSLSVWVRIDGSGKITIYNPVAEMGQGSSTALPLILAEELDADWKQVEVENAPINPEIFGHDAIFGKMMMLTVGSFSVSSYFERLRIAGAQARHVLLLNAAENLAVPISELTTADSMVYHRFSGKQLSYADIAKFALVAALPLDIENIKLKPVDQFKLIGKNIPRVDIAGKLNGTAEYSIDVVVPGMKYGMIERSPVNGDSPLSFNAAELLAKKSISAVFAMDHGVAIIGDNIWAVIQARQALEVSWSKGALADNFDSSKAIEQYAALASAAESPTKVISTMGTSAEAAQHVNKNYQADYSVDFVYHAQMEPLNAVASVSTDGQKLDLWVGSQFPSGLRAEAAKLLNINIDNVNLHPCFLGGGFGRRSWHDFGLEAIQMSAVAKAPVKLLWSREDDLKNGAFRPMSLQRISAGVDQQGSLQSWHHRTIGDDFYLTASGAELPFYQIPYKVIDFRKIDIGIRTKHWRGVAHGPNKFAIESFIDEVALGEAADPYQFRRKLLAQSPRPLKVLDKAVSMSPWGSKPSQGRALGLSFAEGFGSLTAGVVEISLDESLGKIRVHRVWLAVDAGIIVQPDNAIRQLEGGIVQAISSVTLESVTFRDGAIQQSNFHDYPVLKMADTPQITISFIQSELPPSGIGEAAIPFIGGAIGNAFAALTGKRLRHLPFTTNRVKTVLNS